MLHCMGRAQRGLIQLIRPLHTLKAMAASQQATSVLACNLYISEGRNQDILEELEEFIAQDRMVALVHTHVDAAYNRTGFTLASQSSFMLVNAVARMAGAAISALDLQVHEGSHPRLGVVDHISCHPLGSAGLSMAAETARSLETAKPLGEQRPHVQDMLIHCWSEPDGGGCQVFGPHSYLLGSASLSATPEMTQAVGKMIGGAYPNNAPVLLYGAAHPQGRRLQDLRRHLGYFKGSQEGRWMGPLPYDKLPDGLQADFGPSEVEPRVGLVTLGALPWLVNFNVPLKTSDLQAAKNIAKQVSERGGGLPAVEAMALPYGDAVEVACNLSDVSKSSQGAVLDKVRHLAAGQGLEVDGTGYITGIEPEDIIKKVQETAQVLI